MVPTDQINSIDIVMPTMWMVDGITDNLTSYCACSSVNRIIVIDNNPGQRPQHSILKHDKIQLVSYGHNIYVNPAWNEGYYRSRADVLCILNDDISVEDDIWHMMAHNDFSNIDIIGVHLKGSADNFHIAQFDDNTDRIIKLNYDRTQPIGSQAWAFGICMFIKRTSYHVIPSLYQVWFGDDYLVQHNKNIYALSTNKITGEISGTLTKHNENSDLYRRIQLDTQNAYTYNHFHNGRNWDILKHNRYLTSHDMSKYLEIEYTVARRTPSDINQHLPLLKSLADQCQSVTEMGVRWGASTRAFLYSQVKLTSYDIELDPVVESLFEMARRLGRDANYMQANVLDIKIKPCDLLFIDTLHNYDQLRHELELHGNQAQKYLVFHDTQTFGTRDETGQRNQGLLPAIIQFVIDNPHWRFHTHKTENNGLTVLERISNQP